MTEATQSPDKFNFDFNDRELRLLDLAIWRLMKQAHSMSTLRLAQGNTAEANSFLTDAIVAGRLVTRIRSVLFTQKLNRVNDAQPPKEN